MFSHLLWCVWRHVGLFDNGAPPLPRDHHSSHWRCKAPYTKFIQISHFVARISWPRRSKRAPWTPATFASCDSCVWLVLCVAFVSWDSCALSAPCDQLFLLSSVSWSTIRFAWNLVGKHQNPVDYHSFSMFYILKWKCWGIPNVETRPSHCYAVCVCLFVTYVHIQIGSDGLFSKTLLVPEPPMHVMIPETGRWIRYALVISLDSCAFGSKSRKSWKRHLLLYLLWFPLFSQHVQKTNVLDVVFL